MKSNLFNLSDLEKIPILNKIVLKHKKKIKKYSIDLIIRQIIREIINEMVKDLITTTQINIRKRGIKNLNDVFVSKYPVVTFSNKMRKFDKSIKSFLRKNMYYNNKVKLNTNEGKKL